MTRPRLKWKTEHNGNVRTAYSGKLAVGFVILRMDGTYIWEINAVFTRYVTKGRGDTRDFATGRRALVRAWRRWCAHASLVGG